MELFHFSKAGGLNIAAFLPGNTVKGSRMNPRAVQTTVYLLVSQSCVYCHFPVLSCGRFKHTRALLIIALQKVCTLGKFILVKYDIKVLSNFSKNPERREKNCFLNSMFFLVISKFSKMKMESRGFK